MVSLCVATLATNIAANVVSPANDFAHLVPRKISFRTGGYITGVIGVVMMPWKLVADPNGYIFTWLIAYSALLGPIGGILICDYFVIRRTKLNAIQLYERGGEYFYNNGFNVIAMVALVFGVLPNVPGFLGTVRPALAPHIGPFFMRLYDYAWFVGFYISFVVYWVLTSLVRNPQIER
jgi:NCS1 family nucleobase:cation symporter-1